MRIKKYLRGKKSLTCLFAFFVLFVVFVLFVLLVLFVLFVRAKSFRKKNKGFKTALITSFTLPLTKRNLLIRSIEIALNCQNIYANLNMQI